MAAESGEEAKKEPLDKELQHTLEEARTVIPGLQALFGFQLIVPFHPTFKQLDWSLKAVQLSALIACCYGAHHDPRRVPSHGRAGTGLALLD
jgi:hypothetical protein